jgi:hypothetical protein
VVSMERKGIIMQIRENHAVVMSKDCQFVRVPLLEGFTVGQEVVIPAETVAVAQKRGNVWYRRAWKQLAVAAACLVLAASVWGSGMLTSEPRAYAFVTVDINPSIELTIDIDKNVVAAAALNDEGEQLLSELELQGRPVQEAVGKVAETARQKGYLPDNGDVLITASRVENGEEEESLDLAQVEDELVRTVKDVASKQGSSVAVGAVLVSKDVREAAKEAGVSPGKYAFFLSAQSNGVDVELEELKKTSITKLTDQKGVEAVSVFQRMQSGDQLDKLLNIWKTEGKAAFSKRQGDKGTPPGQEKQSDDRPNGKDGRKSDESKANDPGNGQGKDHGKGQSQDKNGKDHSHDDKSANWSGGVKDAPLIQVDLDFDKKDGPKKDDHKGQSQKQKGKDKDRDKDKHKDDKKD